MGKRGSPVIPSLAHPYGDQPTGKRRVYELDFAKLTGEPDVNLNPLPNHGKAVNAGTRLSTQTILI